MCTLVERYLLQEEKINASSLIQIKERNDETMKFFVLNFPTSKCS